MIITYAYHPFPPQVDSNDKLTEVMHLHNNDTPVTCVDWGKINATHSRCVLGSSDNSVRCVTLEFYTP